MVYYLSYQWESKEIWERIIFDLVLRCPLLVVLVSSLHSGKRSHLILIVIHSTLGSHTHAFSFMGPFPTLSTPIHFFCLVLMRLLAQKCSNLHTFHAWRSSSMTPQTWKKAKMRNVFIYQGWGGLDLSGQSLIGES